MRFLSLGDRAFTVEFATGFDDRARVAVTRLDAAIAAAREAGDLQGVVDVAPTFRSLTVHYDPVQTTRAVLEPVVAALVNSETGTEKSPGALWRLPVHYNDAHGPDLAALAESAGLSVAETVALHSATEVTVHMLGFLPGFAFMGDIAPVLRRPRLREPRVRVPAGSVAVADRLTAVYPWESPGGWHLIGHCPVPLFDRTRPKPSLLAPGDRVQFTPVSAADHDAEARALAAGERDVASYRSAP
ncbi:5-oxoprolinase subunit PxpB [Tropicimonas sp. S265A]|uniref:5-oxoprolinase subunit PxpB n=1 Tax=Tropicimonas sp. S265A TaxID=3415134 RepID=UPI003C7E749A